MKLLSVYDNREEECKNTGNKRLANECGSTIVIYNLFESPSRGNFYRLGILRSSQHRSDGLC